MSSDATDSGSAMSRPLKQFWIVEWRAPNRIAWTVASNICEHVYHLESVNEARTLVKCLRIRKPDYEYRIARYERKAIMTLVA